MLILFWHLGSGGNWGMGTFLLFKCFYFSLPLLHRCQASTEDSFQRCKDVNEAYAAAWLTTTRHLFRRDTNYKLDDKVLNCESASWMMMETDADPDKEIPGAVVQSVDVLDFSAVHLSWYERLERRHLWTLLEHLQHLFAYLGVPFVKMPQAIKLTRSNYNSTVTRQQQQQQQQQRQQRQQQSTQMKLKLRGEGIAFGHGIINNGTRGKVTKGEGGKSDKGWRTEESAESHPIEAVRRELRRRAKTLRRPDIPFADDNLNRTIAVMPFLGAERGAGNSLLDARFLYLKATFWSIYASIPNIAVFVRHAKDADLILHQSGLPFFDVVLLDSLPSSQSLPVASVQQTKARLLDGRWKGFDFVYYTESDQLLMLRSPSQLFAYLQDHPRTVITPHRLPPYPEKVLTDRYKRNVSTAHLMDWVDARCCLPRQHCENRRGWARINGKGGKNIPVLNVYGLQVALGNVNFLLESYRFCALDFSGKKGCP